MWILRSAFPLIVVLSLLIAQTLRLLKRPHRLSVLWMNDSSTPLHLVAANGHLAVANRLTKAEAPVNDIDTPSSRKNSRYGSSYRFPRRRQRQVL